MRKTSRLEEAAPVLYLRGISTGDFQEALACFSLTPGARRLLLWQDGYQS
jgi:hypothetical protein